MTPPLSISSSHARPRRERAVLLALSVGALLLFARLVALQVLEHEGFKTLAANQSMAEEEIPGPRGDVCDRRGTLLAISSPVKALTIEPARMEEESLRALERALGLDRGALLRHRDRLWRIAARECDLDCQSRVLALVSAGAVSAKYLHWEPSYTRTYPQLDLAAQTLGFINREGATEGIERSYDHILRAKERRVLFRQDALQNAIAVIDTDHYASAPTSLMLTLDARLQRTLEDELRAAIDRHGASGAQGIVIDPRNGDVLAMASLPTFDPNDFGRAAAGTTRNRVIGAAYEQGSVMKPIVAAALVEAGLYRPGRSVHCENGSWTTHGRTIRDVHPHEALTLPEVLQVSSNIGIVKFARDLPAQRLHETFSRFGFGKLAGIDLPAESAGKLWPVEKWKPIEKDSAAFGYYLSATQLQVALAYAAIGRDGLLPVPRVVRAFGSPQGSWHRVPVEEPVRVVSRETARLVAGWLVDVVEAEKATGAAARVPGYRVAGKTGTAWMAGKNGGYDMRRMRATFAGFAPAHDPVAVAVISIEAPQRNGWGGGAVAAPVFRTVMAEALRLSRVIPTEPIEPDEAEADDGGDAQQVAREGRTPRSDG